MAVEFGSIGLLHRKKAHNPEGNRSQKNDIKS
jgi:hypothetical protein